MAATTETEWVKQVQQHREWDWKESHRLDAPDLGHAKLGLVPQGLDIRCACHDLPCTILDSFKNFALVKAPGNEGTFAVPTHDRNVRDHACCYVRTVDVGPRDGHALTLAEAGAAKAGHSTVVVGLRIEEGK